MNMLNCSRHVIVVVIVQQQQQQQALPKETNHMVSPDSAIAKCNKYDHDDDGGDDIDDAQGAWGWKISFNVAAHACATYQVKRK